MNSHSPIRSISWRVTEPVKGAGSSELAPQGSGSSNNGPDGWDIAEAILDAGWSPVVFPLNVYESYKAYDAAGWGGLFDRNIPARPAYHNFAAAKDDFEHDRPGQGVFHAGVGTLQLASVVGTALAAGKVIPAMRGGVAKTPAASTLGPVDDAVTGFRAVSRAEAADIAEHGFRPDPSGRSMESKWFSESAAGAEWFRNNLSGLDEVVEASVPRAVYDASYKHTNIDGTGPGFCVDCSHLPQLTLKARRSQ